MSRAEIAAATPGAVLQFKNLQEVTAYFDKYRHLMTESSDAAGMGAYSRGTETREFLAKGGYWPEGVESMGEKMEIAGRFLARSLRPTIQRDYVGSTPCVGAAMTGHPKAMFKRKPGMRVDKPILNIGIGTGQPVGGTFERRMNRGAAILTGVRQLERMGYRVQLDMVHRQSNDQYLPMTTPQHWWSIETSVKTPDQRLNPASAAFVICHENYHCCVHWGILETFAKKREGLGQVWNHGRTIYGMPYSEEPWHDSMTMDYDLYLEPFGDDIYRWNNIESSLEAVQTKINTTLDQLAEGAGQRR